MIDQLNFTSYHSDMDNHIFSSTMPSFPGHMIRERLFSLLHKHINRKIMLVHGKAGQGKTSLLVEFLKKSAIRCVWISLDAIAGNPDGFLHSISGSLTSVVSDRGNSDISTNYVISLLSSIDRAPVYIVLDNYENIKGDDVVNGYIDTLISRTPANIHFIILSRELPDLALSKYRSRRQVFELTDKDLAFNEDEVRQLADYYKLDISPDDFNSINELIAGWTIGYVYLFEKLNLAVDEEEFREVLYELFSDRGILEIDEYFESEILPGIPESFFESIVKISFFDLLTLDLIREILRDHSEATLYNLENHCYFISQIDKRKKHYSVHPLFAKYLDVYRVQIDKDEIERILGIGADFFEIREDYDRAIALLLKLGKEDEARSLLLKIADTLLDQSRYKVLRHILKQFRRGFVLEDPYLRYYQNIAYSLIRPYKSRRNFPEIIKTMVELEDYDKVARIYSALLASYFFYQGDLEIVSATSREAGTLLQEHGDKISLQRKEILEALIPLGRDWRTPVDDLAFENVMIAEETSQRLNNQEAFLCSRLVLARKYIQKGDFREANRLLELTKNIFSDQQQDHPYRALVYYYLGDSYFYLGEIDKALQSVRDALQYFSPSFAFHSFLEQSVILYHFYLDKYDQVEQLIESIAWNNEYKNHYYTYFRSYLLPLLNAYRDNNERRCDYYSKRLLAPENEALINSDYPYSYLQLIEVNVAFGNYENAEELIRKIENDLTPESMPLAAATLHALKGLLFHNLGKTRNTTVEFDKMHEILMRRGYVNLDICNPEILGKIAQISHLQIFEKFPRLKYRSIERSLDEKSYIMEVRSLGRLSLFVNGKEIEPSTLLSQKKVMDLLKLLIVYRKNGILKEVVYKILWSNYSSKSSRDNLNSIIYRLRNILGKENEILATDSFSIGFFPGSTDIDVDRFFKYLRLAELAERQNEWKIAIEMHKKAQGLYHGDFLENDIYSDYIRDEREHLKQKYRSSLFKLSKLYLSSGNYLAAIDILKQLMSNDLLSEAATRLLMITSALIGSRSSIPQIFEKLNQQLQESYDVTADTKTVHLKDLLLSGVDPTPDMWMNETII